MRFNFLHKKDNGRIFNERHCTVCDEKVDYADLVRGYEYEKGHYVTLSDDDFKSVAPEATQSVEIVEFVELDQINPMYFDTPYFLEPEKKGRHAYALSARIAQRCKQGRHRARRESARANISRRLSRTVKRSCSS